MRHRLMACSSFRFGVWMQAAYISMGSFLLALTRIQNKDDIICRFVSLRNVFRCVIQFGVMYINWFVSINSCVDRPLIICSQLLLFVIALPKSVFDLIWFNTVVIFCAPCIAYRSGTLYYTPCISARDVVLIYPMAGRKLNNARDWMVSSCSREKLQAGRL